MYHKLSQKLTNRFARWEWTEAEQVGWCVYTVEKYLQSATFFISTGIIVFLMGKVMESIIFVATFMAMRRCMGGWHAKSPLVCLIISAVAIIVCVFGLGTLMEKIPPVPMATMDMAILTIYFIIKPVYVAQLHFTSPQCIIIVVLQNLPQYKNKAYLFKWDSTKFDKIRGGINLKRARPGLPWMGEGLATVRSNVIDFHKAGIQYVSRYKNITKAVLE